MVWLGQFSDFFTLLDRSSLIGVGTRIAMNNFTSPNGIKRQLGVIACLVVALGWPFVGAATTVPAATKLTFELALPDIKTSQYNRPYVAVWVENADREVVRTVSLWLGKDEWHKDLRSWWRKIGRYQQPWLDGVTGATKPAGSYKFDWSLIDDQGEKIPAGDYTVHIEVVREHGGRNYLKQPIHLGEQGVVKVLEPTAETGPISLIYQP